MQAEVIIPLLGTLFDRGKKFTETAGGMASEAEIYELLQDRAGGSIADFRYIESLVTAKDAFSTSDAATFIRLPDVEEGGARLSPLVYLDGDLRGTSPYFRLQVVLVVHANAATATAKTIAVRFETPEDAGKHSYYHSQICVTIRRGSGTDTMNLDMEPSWFPTSHPAWPMDAESPAELLVCLVLSLYGKVVGGQIIDEAGVRCGRDLFEEVLAAMRTKFRNVNPSDSPTRKAPRSKAKKLLRRKKKLLRRK